MAQGFFHEENYVQCGNYIYSNLGNWFYNYGGIGVIFSDVHLFDGTLTHNETNGNNETTEVNYPNLNYGPNELMDYFNQLYCDRFLLVPFKDIRIVSETDKAAFLSDCTAKLRSIVKHYSDTNSDKFLGLLETMFFEYNPIENYNMTESGTDVQHPELTTTIDGDGTTTVNGTTTTTNTAGSGANMPTTKNYTTTYDDSSEGRLQSYSTTQGQTTTTVTGGPTTTTNNNSTKTERGTDTLIHSLNRSGNIGVTTTQQMIEQEREILKFNIIKEYFEGLVPLITLAI